MCDRQNLNKTDYIHVNINDARNPIYSNIFIDVRKAIGLLAMTTLSQGKCT